MNTKLYITGIFITALLLGVSFILLFPQFKLSIDAIDYDTLGWNLAQGRGYQIEKDKPDASREPLYPLFLSIIYSVFGHSYFAVRIIQAIMNACMCVIIYFIGKETLGLKSGLIASFIAAIYPAFIAYTGYILTEILFTFLLMAAVLILIKALKQRLFRWYILTGFILGLAILCKAFLIIFPFFVCMLILFIPGPNKKKIISVFCVILFALAAVLPWTIRNYQVFHTLIPIRSGAGLGMWGGSYLAWEGKGRGGRGGYSEVRIQYIEEEPLKSLIKGLTPAEIDKVLMRESIRNIKDNPMGYIRLSFQRFLMLWMHPIGEELIGARNVFLSKALLILHYIMLLFFTIGIILFFRNFKLYPLVMFLIVIYITAIYSLTYASPRYHFPALPSIMLFASYSFLYLLERIKK